MYIYHTVAGIVLVQLRHSLRVQQDRYALASETSPGVPEEMTRTNADPSACIAPRRCQPRH